MILMLILGGFGAAMGSFACCMVRRMRRKEEGGDLELSKWSACESCGSRIGWRDNVPVLSWFVLGGKCRKCGAKIGVMEILAELFGAFLMMFTGAIVVAFNNKARSVLGLASGNNYAYGDIKNGGFLGFWDFSRLFGENYAFGDIIFLVILAIFLVILMILVIYDAKWQVMPMKVLMALVGVGVLMEGMTIWRRTGQGWDVISILIDLVLAVGILAGVYFAIYKISNENAVGGGDWILGLGIALSLGSAAMAFLTLFLANLMGSLVMLPQLKKSEKRQIPMAPFLAIGFLLSIFVVQLPTIQRIIRIFLMSFGV